jgi:tetratricopeptide (TPR) repeat protein
MGVCFAQQSGPATPFQIAGSPSVPSRNYDINNWIVDTWLEGSRAPSSASRKPRSFFDEIEDPAERKAFRALFLRKKPEERRRLAEAFLKRYTKSAFLAQALEIAAKACIDLGDHKAALAYGRESLKLLPENPLLVVPLATVEMQQGETAEAAHSARRALDFLDRFTRPSLFSDKDWAVVEAQLRASCYYILGAAAAAKGVRASSGEREHELKKAEAFLSQSWQLSASDAATAYLLGLTRMAQAKVQEAAVAFAAAYRQGGPFKEKAAKYLREIDALGSSKPRNGFDAFLKNVETDTLEVPRDEKVEKRLPGQVHSSPPAYAGSPSCQSCHPREYAGWEQSGHARMFRPYESQNVFGDFRNQTYADETGTVVARMTEDGKRHYFQIRDTEGRWHRYQVDYTIGSKWQQTYATRLPNGEIQVFPLQYSRLRQRWVAFWKMIDPPGAERGQVSNFPKLRPETAYLAICGPCHTSQLRLAKAGSREAKDLTFTEGGINCEMCHGPSAPHVASMRRATPNYRPPLELLVEFGKISSRDYVAICAQCHLQSAVRAPGPQGEMNYRHAPDTFFVHYRSHPYSDCSRRAFYKDGRFRVISFAVESFLRSRCYQEGQAHCGHCHDFHSLDSTNERGLKFLDQPDQMCLQCHPEYAGKLEEHTRHAAKSEGSRCIACHMPRNMSSLLFDTCTHQIDEIPDAEMTARFGQKDSPNACLICHTDKDLEWLRQELNKRPRLQKGTASLVP